MKNIRNFSIIAHVDHGKSTLADRFIQECGGLDAREMQAQVLDSMDLERERGITIKAQSVTLAFKSVSGEIYQLNFIDTPGHVDFSYEVSRSLAACEGALLVVDAAQGVEAQSVANCYTALEQGLEVLPVINKIDLPSADPAKVIHEIEEIIGIPAEDAALVSAKTGLGVPELLEQLVKRIPAPEGRPGRSVAGADHRFLVRQLCGRGLAGARDEWCAAHRRQDPRHVHRPQPPGRQARPLRAQTGDPRVVAHRRGRIRHRRHQGDRRRAGRRHHHAGKQSRPSAARGLQAGPAAGVRRLVSGEFGRLRAVPRGAEETQAQRFGAAFRARGVDRARLRIPLRVPRAAAHGHRAGAAGARVRPGPHHQRADRDLRGAAHGWVGGQCRQSDQAAAPGPHHRAARADHHRQYPGAAGSRGRGADPVQRKARRAEENAVSRQPGIAAI